MTGAITSPAGALLYVEAFQRDPDEGDFVLAATVHSLSRNTINLSQFGNFWQFQNGRWFRITEEIYLGNENEYAALKRIIDIFSSRKRTLLKGTSLGHAFESLRISSLQPVCLKDMLGPGVVAGLSRNDIVRYVFSTGLNRIDAEVRILKRLKDKSGFKAKILKLLQKGPEVTHKVGDKLKVYPGQLYDF